MIAHRLWHIRRMLLTSAGIRNEVLKSALAGLTGRPFASATVALVPAGSVTAAEDGGWFVNDLNRLRHANGIYAEGSNHYRLANGLAADTAEIVESKIYVGVSAGSMIFSRGVRRARGPADPRRSASASTTRAVYWHLNPPPELPPAGTLDWYGPGATNATSRSMTLTTSRPSAPGIPTRGAPNKKVAVARAGEAP
jgi:dipeptidase E